MATTSRSRLGRIPGVSTLQQVLSQPVETVTRTARFERSGAGVDEIDPPEDLDEFWEQYKETAIVRANLNQFVSDVVSPGARVEVDEENNSAPNATRDYFMGGDNAPQDTPEGGFMEQCFVFAGERRQPFMPGLKSTILNRWVRGTDLNELLKADPEDAESPIHGFYKIRPETVHPQVYENTNILLDPDPNAEANEDVGFKETPRGEAAAYIQFADDSILGRRLGGFDDREEIRLSQNDVLKQVLDPDIGGDSATEQGVFGESIMQAIGTDVEEYNKIKRDRFHAIQRKAYGIWLFQFEKEAVELGNGQFEIVEWDDDSQNEFSDELDSLGPGDVLEADGPVDPTEFPSEVPDLNDELAHYVSDIVAPLPAPKYATAFGESIANHVSDRQENAYEQRIVEERQYQGRKWSWAFRKVADRHPDLDPTGLRVLLEPEQDTSPVKTLTKEETEKMLDIARAYNELAGPTAGPGTLVDDVTLLTELMQLPEDVGPEVEEALGQLGGEPEDE